MSLAERLAKAERPDRIQEVRSRIQERLVEVLGPALYDAAISEKELRDLVHKRLRELLDDEEISLSIQEKAQITRQIGDSIVGFGPLEPFIRDPDVSEIMVNTFETIYVERAGKLYWTGSKFLDACVRGKINILVSGGTGAGKTTTLNVLSSFIPPDERIITIEDAAELRLQQPHVVRLEQRPPNIEGRGEVTIRDLVRNALRMRPDCIVVAEVRGGEALDMLQAMNTGHDGSISTIHSNSPRDSLSRLETVTMIAGTELTVRAIREQIASAIQMIVHQARLKDGTRRLTHVTEVVGMEGDVITLQDIFLFDFHAGLDPEGRFRGELQPTGLRPKFLEKLSDKGVHIPPAMFAPHLLDGRAA